MNLPPDKVQLLSQYDNEKKWELICDQVGASKPQLPLLLLLGNPVPGCKSWQERSLPAAQELISTKVAGAPCTTLYSNGSNRWGSAAGCVLDSWQQLPLMLCIAGD